MELRELNCKRCGAPIAGADIDMAMGIARCAHCGTVFSIQSEAGRPAPAAPSDPARAPVPMPKNVEVADNGVGLQITYRWFSLKHIFLIVFAVFWNGFMIVWHSISLLSGAWFMSIFGLLHTAVGVFVAYSALTGLINRTTIWVEMGTLTIRHHPLPWPGNKQLDETQIDQLYTKEKVSRTKNGTSYSYEVHAMLRSGGKEKLVGGLNEVEQALYIEQALERRMGIRDQPVRGEYPR